MNRGKKVSVKTESNARKQPNPQNPKYVTDKDGNVLHTYADNVQPEDLEDLIETPQKPKYVTDKDGNVLHTYPDNLQTKN